jgi:hypothetical protein|tara:strand:- start:201 stop:620 length:420 start_codon:yes stop_codon:yes gene_type:complete
VVDVGFAVGVSHCLYGPYETPSKSLFETNTRHTLVIIEGNILKVFWSREGDAPERLLVSQVELSRPHWNNWQATVGAELLRPELSWKGVDIPVMSSLRGEMNSPFNELRDPYILSDVDGKEYFFYAGGGEQAFGIALLK